MIKIYITFLFLISSSVFSQVGIPTNTPQGILDLNNHEGNSNYGLVLPKANLEEFQNAIPGTMIFDTKSQCVRVKGENGWGDCLSLSENISAEGNCFYHKGINYCVEEVNGYYWIDRSLGATSHTGDNAWFIQYGRADDGHQISSSQTINYASLATSGNIPINVFETNSNYTGKFIVNPDAPNWMFPDIEMKHAWDQSRAHLTNNPCPKNYGIPTSQQFIYYLQNKGLSQVSKKGFRNKANGNIANPTEGHYWLSDKLSKKGTYMTLKINPDNTYQIVESSQAHGLNVKCIKIN